jgi:hypothetical protein
MTFSALCAVNLILKPFFFLEVNTGYVVFVKPVRENHSSPFTPTHANGTATAVGPSGAAVAP